MLFLDKYTTINLVFLTNIIVKLGLGLTLA